MAKSFWAKTAVGLAVAGLVVAGGGWATSFVARAAAPTGTSASQATSLRQYLEDHFLTNLAAKLGIDRYALVKDVNDSLSQAVKDAQGAGKLSADQAQRLTQRIQRAQSNGRPGWFGFGGPGGRFGFRGPMLKEAAGVIGISAQDLATALKDGQTLAQVAQAHGVSQDALVNGLVDALKKHLDQAVKDGRLTSDQEQKILSASRDRIAKAVTETGFPGHRGAWGKPGARPDKPPMEPTTSS